MVVKKNSEDSFNPGVEIAVIRDMEGGLLLVCSASGKWGKMMIIRVMENKLMMMMMMMMITFSPAPALSWAVMVGDKLEEVADRVTWHPTKYDQVGLLKAENSMFENF